MAGKNCFVYIPVALFFAFNGSFAVYRAFFSKNTFSFKEFLIGILFFAVGTCLTVFLWRRERMNPLPASVFELAEKISFDRTKVPITPVVNQGVSGTVYVLRRRSPFRLEYGLSIFSLLLFFFFITAELSAVIGGILMREKSWGLIIWGILFGGAGLFVFLAQKFAVFDAERKIFWRRKIFRHPEYRLDLLPESVPFSDILAVQLLEKWFVPGKGAGHMCYELNLVRRDYSRINAALSSGSVEAAKEAAAIAAFIGVPVLAYRCQTPPAP